MARLRKRWEWGISPCMEVTDPWRSFADEFGEAAEACGFRREILYHTPAGSVSAWTRGVPGAGKDIYLSSGIHGDEPAGPLALLELMRAGFFQREISWAICPALNPAGLLAGRRENADGIDLNRDYRIRATPEVAAHVDWLSRRPRTPDLFLSLHEDWESSGFYFYEINHGKDHPARAAAILSAVSPWFPSEDSAVIDGHTVREKGWIYHPPEADEPEGWPEAIFLSHLGCPISFTFETPSRRKLADRIAAQIAAVKAACDW